MTQFDNLSIRSVNETKLGCSVVGVLSFGCSVAGILHVFEEGSKKQIKKREEKGLKVRKIRKVVSHSIYHL